MVCEMEVKYLVAEVDWRQRGYELVAVFRVAATDLRRGECELAAKYLVAEVDLIESVYELAGVSRAAAVDSK